MPPVRARASEGPAPRGETATQPWEGSGHPSLSSEPPPLNRDSGLQVTSVASRQSHPATDGASSEEVLGVQT